MKTVVIPSFHTIISRNILSTPILRDLLSSAVRVVILVSKKQEAFFREEFGNSGAIIEALDLSIGFRDIFLRYLSLSALLTASLNLKRKTEMKGSGNYLILLTPLSLRQWLVRFLSKTFAPSEPFIELFLKYDPTLIFGTDVANDLEVRLLAHAKRRGVPTVSMVRSWDNLTSKGYIRIVPDELLVWNDLIKKEAIKLHHVPEEKIAVVGIPHYDAYLKSPSLSGRGLRQKLGIPDNKKFITFAPAGDRYLDKNTVDRDIVFLLEKYIPIELDILVRLPFSDTVSLLEKEKFSSRVHIYRPGTDFKVIKNTELSKEEEEILIATLKYSELIVVGPSTFVIDAALFDKPIIVVGFDGLEERPYLKGIC